MGKKKRPWLFNIVIIAWTFSLILDILYWVLFFFVPNSVQVDSADIVYMTHQMTFPVADAFLGAALFLGIVYLWKMKPRALLFGLLNGGAAVFLGLMDLTYDLQTGMLLNGGADIAIELVILFITLILSPIASYIIWTRRELLLK
jgi:hypothetical protein